MPSDKKGSEPILVGTAFHLDASECGSSGEAGLCWDRSPKPPRCSDLYLEMLPEPRGKNWSFSVRADRKYPALSLERIKSTLLTIWNYRRSQNSTSRAEPSALILFYVRAYDFKIFISIVARLLQYWKGMFDNFPRMQTNLSPNNFRVNHRRPAFYSHGIC